MPTTRDVIATAYKPTGEVWPGAPYEFTLTPGTYLPDAAGSQFPSETVRRLSEADGRLRLPLQLNSGVLGSEYFVTEPNGAQYSITVVSGVGDLTLSDARTQYAGLSTPTYANLAAYVDARVAAIVFPWSNISSFAGSSLAQLETRLFADLQSKPTTLAGYGITDGGGSGGDAGTLTGTTLAANVVTSSLTTIGTLVAGAVPASLLTGTTLPASIVTSSLTTVGTLAAGAVPASLVTAGTFPAGAYAFQGAVSGITTLIVTSTSTFGHTAVLAAGSPNTPGSAVNPTQGLWTTAPLGHAVGRWSTSAAGGGGTAYARSKAAAIGTFAALASGDRLWTLAFTGDDGTDLATQAGYLRWEVAGTVATNRVPGRLLIGLAAGASDDDVTEYARHTITGLSLGTTTAPTVAGSLAAIGTGRFGPSVITAGVTLEANSATGTATVVPTTIAIRSSSSAQDWATTSFANLDYISNDSGVTSAPVRGRIGVNMTTATGATSSMLFYVGGSSTTLDLALTLGPTLLATFAGAVTVTGALTAALTGNATTATTLATSRNIHGVAFNGSADITLVPRVASATSSATPTPNADTTDVFILTALAAAAEFQIPSGTPVQGQRLLIRIKDDGTGRALTYNAIFRAIGVTLPTTTVAGKTHYLGAVYNSVGPKWDVLAVGAEA